MAKNKVPPPVDFANAARRLAAENLPIEKHQILAVTLAVQLWAKEIGISLDAMGAEELLDFMLDDLENMQ